MDVAGRVALRFTGDVVRGGSHDNLTAVRADGEHLWVAGDETATIDRLVLDSATAPTRAGRQRSFRLADLVQLPGPPEGETDLQGIARSGGWLWAIGSHALVRRRPKPIHDDAKVVRRLGKLRRDPNRFVIVRLAVQLGVDRRPEPVRVARDGRRSALVGAPRAETLVDLLRADTHLAPFLAIPGQDNGFDVGGLAVVGDRLYVGLRGPVLRGWAVVLEVRPAQDPTDPGRLALGIFPEGARYRKHVLDLGGLGRPRPVPGRRRPAGAGGADDGAVGAGAGAPLAGRGRRRRWAGGARRRAARRDGGAQRGGRGPRLGDLTARPGPARPATRGCSWSTPIRRRTAGRGRTRCWPTGCGSGAVGGSTPSADPATADPADAAPADPGPAPVEPDVVDPAAAPTHSPDELDDDADPTSRSTRSPTTGSRPSTADAGRRCVGPTTGAPSTTGSTPCCSPTACGRSTSGVRLRRTSPPSANTAPRDRPRS